MFTGIITDVGKIKNIKNRSETRIEFETQLNVDDFELGGSIACCGVCLTVVDLGVNWFAADVSSETLQRTTFGSMRIGAPVNIERPLKASDELGGHIVSGHVDGIGVVKSIVQDGESKCFWFEVLPSLLKYIAIKGSVAVDGVSLTVNEVNDTGFAVHIIPHTQSHTKLGTIAVEEPVNIEIDLLARYVARILERN